MGELKINTMRLSYMITTDNNIMTIFRQYFLTSETKITKKNQTKLTKTIPNFVAEYIV